MYLICDSINSPRWHLPFLDTRDFHSVEPVRLRDVLSFPWRLFPWVIEHDLFEIGERGGDSRLGAGAAQMHATTNTTLLGTATSLQVLLQGRAVR